MKKIDEWKKCGLAVYEKIHKPIKYLRVKYHCQQCRLACDNCPMYMVRQAPQPGGKK